MTETAYEPPDRTMGADSAYAVGRFREDGPLGYRAKSAPDAPLRSSRAEAVEDERDWLNRRHRAK